MGELSLNTFISLCDTDGFGKKKENPRRGERVAFLGLYGLFLNPAIQMSLKISLPIDKAINWSQITNAMINDGAVSHSQLGN